VAPITEVLDQAFIENVRAIVEVSSHEIFGTARWRIVAGFRGKNHVLNLNICWISAKPVSVQAGRISKTTNLVIERCELTISAITIRISGDDILEVAYGFAGQAALVARGSEITASLEIFWEVR
jgi:hypothetical protein